MIGQWELRSQVLVKVRAAKMRGELPSHFLFYGPPGLGKTTLAQIVAFELDSPIRIVEATAVNTVTKLANVLGDLDRGTTLFIDEIHALPRTCQEMLGLAMEDGRITVSIGVNRTQQRAIDIEIKPFVCVGATTLAGNLTGPLRDRFGFVGGLTFYEDSELADIISRASQ
jgi:Holliday junction DNA helicase RuvB